MYICCSKPTKCVNQLQKCHDFFLINSYFMVNFNHGPLVWMLSSACSLKKNLKFTEKSTKILMSWIWNFLRKTLPHKEKYWPEITPYLDTFHTVELLSKSSAYLMNVKRSRELFIELYKTVNKLNPNFTRDLFKLRLANRPILEKYRMNMFIPGFNQVFYGKEGLRIFGPKLWNSRIILNLLKI